jgi:hypothetical protein
LDIDADEDLNQELEQQNEVKEEQQDSDIYIPPSQGSDPLLQGIRKNPLVASLHVAIGDFPKALDLLRKQVAVQQFEPLR